MVLKKYMKESKITDAPRIEIIQNFSIPKENFQDNRTIAK
jgi:hypothetical protein